MSFQSVAQSLSFSFKMRHYSLAFLTVNELDPINAIRIASRCGYDSVGLRFIKASATEPDYFLMENDDYLIEVGRILKETGVTVADAELIRLNSSTYVHSFKSFFERASYLGVRHVIVAGDDENHVRITKNFEMLCTLAAEYNMSANLEPMPWTKVPNIQTALRIVEDAGMSNGNILVDALHFNRSGDNYSMIQSIPPERMQIFQICDAPSAFDSSTDALIHTARANRLFPGDGDIDLYKILDYIPSHAIISVEVPNAQIVSPELRAMIGLEKTKKIMMESNNRIGDRR